MNLKNMLILNQGLPYFKLFNVNLVENTINNLILEQHNKFTDLESKLSNEVDNNNLYNLAIYETEKIEYPLSFAWSVISHLKAVKSSDELRGVYNKCLPNVIKENSYMSQSVPLFKAFEKLKNVDSLNEVQKRIIDSSYKSMYLSGINLEGDNKNEFNDIKVKLSELSNKFSNAMSKAFIFQIKSEIIYKPCE